MSNGQYPNKNTAHGEKAMHTAIAAGSNGFDNTAYGADALRSLDDGIRENSAFGSGALRYAIMGENSAFGAHACAHGGLASGNAAFGNWALRYVEGKENSAFGHRAMAGDENSNVFSGDTTVGKYNCAFGASSMRYNPNGDENVAFGHNSLNLITLGFNNTAVGKDAGETVTSGSNNTFLGHGADASSGSAEFRTAIGSGVTATQDNTVILGRSTTDKVGIRTTAPDSILHVMGSTTENAVHVQTVGSSAFHGINVDTGASSTGHGVAAMTGASSFGHGVVAMTGATSSGNAVHASVGAMGTGNAVHASIGATETGNAVYASSASKSPTVSVLNSNVSGYALNVNGGHRNKVTHITGPATPYMANINDYVMISTGANPVNITLPDPAVLPDGHTFIIRHANTSAGPIKIDSVGGLPVFFDFGIVVPVAGVTITNVALDAHTYVTAGGMYYRIA